jgi:hypothetical protein
VNKFRYSEVYDPNTKLLYLGYGGRMLARSMEKLASSTPGTDKHIGDVQVKAHPSELLLDKSGHALPFSFSSPASFRLWTRRSVRWCPPGLSAASEMATEHLTKKNRDYPSERNVLDRVANFPNRWL